MTKLAETLELHMPTPKEMSQAKESSRILASVVGEEETHVRLVDRGEVVALPGSAMRLFVDLLEHMARGEAVRVVGAETELSTTQAADILNVSRPYLIGLLEAGQIPCRKVGQHRRIPAAALLDYKERSLAKSKAVLDELTREAQDLGIHS